jgi:hypothetical protein
MGLYPAENIQSTPPPPMKSIKALLLSVLLATPALAGSHGIPGEKPVATVNFPEGWTVSDHGESIDACSDDKEIYLNLELNDAGTIDSATDETLAYLKKNKVEIDPKSQKEASGEANGMKVTTLAWEGKDAEGPTKVSVSFFEISSKKLLLMLYWATPESENKHDDDLGAIVTSLKTLE